MSATQRLRILNLLLSAPGQFVPAVELSKISLQYNARLLELRRLGYEIKSKTQRVRVGARSVVVHSWFCLLTENQSRAFAIGRSETPKPPKPELEKQDDEPLLFSDLKAQHRDDG